MKAGSAGKRDSRFGKYQQGRSYELNDKKKSRRILFFCLEGLVNESSANYPERTVGLEKDGEFS